MGLFNFGKRKYDFEMEAGKVYYTAINNLYEYYILEFDDEKMEVKTSNKIKFDLYAAFYILGLLVLTENQDYFSKFTNNVVFGVLKNNLSKDEFNYVLKRTDFYADALDNLIPRAECIIPLDTLRTLQNNQYGEVVLFLTDCIINPAMIDDYENASSIKKILINRSNASIALFATIEAACVDYVTKLRDVYNTALK